MSAKRDIETHRDMIETKKKAQSPTVLSPFPWVSRLLDTRGGGGCSPQKNQKKNKKNQKKKTKPIYQFWCSDRFFLGFFVFFLVFFCFFLGWFSNPKFKYQKKNQKKPKNQFQISNVGQGLCQKTKKTKKNQFPISYFGQNQCQKKPKKKPMPIWKF